VRRNRDRESYTIRFTPRKPGSTWSAVNIRLVTDLEAAGSMTPAGRTAFAARTEAKSGVYSFEQDKAAFDDRSLLRFKANRTAWMFFQAQPPGYQKRLTWRVISAKKPETRDSRLTSLIEVSANGKRLA
jgi:uncharacterized protein YdeI (YjbR/CyaY-like superfamily)